MRRCVSHGSFLQGSARVGLVFATGLGSAAVHAADTEHRALFMGNSYTQVGELDRLVTVLARDSMGRDGFLGTRRLTAGGLRMTDLLSRVAGGDPGWTETFLMEPAWSTVVLQDQSQIPGFPESESIWQDSARAFAELDGMVAERGADTMLFVTWGRRDGDADNPSLYPDFSTMNDRLEAGYAAYADGAGDRTVYFAPASRAFAAVHDGVVRTGADPLDSASNFHRLYQSDGSHPSGLGSALVAGVMLKAMTGWEPQWLTPPADGTMDDTVWMTDAVDEAVQPFGDLPWAWTTLLADYAPPIDIEVPADTLVVSGALRCTTVGSFDGAHGFGTLRVGAGHTAGGGCGRVWVSGDDALVLDRIDLGTRGRQGHLVVVGGSLEAAQVAMGSDTGMGSVRVSGGTLTIGEVLVQEGIIAVSGGSLQLDSSNGSIRQTGGRLALTDGAALGGLDQQGGELELMGTAGPLLTVAGSVTLDGTLSVPELSGDAPVVAVDAEGLTLGEHFSADLPSGWTWALEDNQRLVLEPRGGGSDGTGGDDGEDIDDTDVPDDDDEPAGTTGTVRVAPEKDAEGCAASGSLGGVMVLGLFGLGRRRRQ